MFTLYTVLKSLHVIAVVVWIGGGATLVHLMASLGREREPVALSALLRNGAIIGQRVYAPATLVLVVTGFWMIANGNLDFELWIILGLIAWLAGAVHGALFMGKQSAKLSEEVAAGTVAGEAIGGRLRTIILHGSVELGILLLVVADMVIKPGS
jgi:uncharacterized membrane protein